MQRMNMRMRYLLHGKRPLLHLIHFSPLVSHSPIHRLPLHSHPLIRSLPRPSPLAELDNCYELVSAPWHTVQRIHPKFPRRLAWSTTSPKRVASLDPLLSRSIHQANQCIPFQKANPRRCISERHNHLVMSIISLPVWIPDPMLMGHGTRRSMSCFHQLLQFHNELLSVEDTTNHQDLQSNPPFLNLILRRRQYHLHQQIYQQHHRIANLPISSHPNHPTSSPSPLSHRSPSYLPATPFSRSFESRTHRNYQHVDLSRLLLPRD
mmetsp:Transcript_2821/g.6111  ORF Transcript_2821/g.6111 Transcript_2821/m.6111 type:complete len:264 (+) Transcript_2821:3373-4164(+)